MVLSRRQRRQQAKAIKTMSHRDTEYSSDAQKKEPGQQDKSKEEKASFRVASIYELLEGILVQLPPRNLFVFQSVNSAWHDLINRSHNVQRQMGLKTRGTTVDIDSRLNIEIRLLFDDTIEKGDSWRNTQVADPPVSSIIIDSDMHRMDSITIECEDGLTLGKVEEAREIWVNQLWEEKGVKVSRNDVYAAIPIDSEDVAPCEHIAEHHFAGVTRIWHDVLHDCHADHEGARFCRDFVDKEKMWQAYEPMIWF